MAKSILTVRVDQQTKTKARQLAQDAGLSLSHLVDLQLQKLVSEGRVDINPDIKLNPVFEKRLEKIDADLKSDRNIEGPFKTTEELFEALSLPKKDDA